MRDDEFLEEVSPEHKVLYLLMNGWDNLEEIRSFLGLSVKQMEEIVKMLSLRGIITTHTIPLKEKASGN